MIVPGRLALMLAAILALVLIAAIVEPAVAGIAVLGDALIIAASLWEGRGLKRAPVDIERENWVRVQVGRAEEFTYRIANRSRRSLVVHIRQPWPDGIEGTVNTAMVSLAPGEVVRLALTATPRVRGVIEVPPARIDVHGPADIARWRSTLPTGAQVKVFPSLRGMTEYEALRRQHASSLVGLHRQRMLGSGREFDQLRDYFSGDDYRDVNWKATARRNRPITNMYQEERSHDVVLCLDCGRMMGNPVGAGTALDYAVDASIMLAHVANRHGDRVGLALFGDVVHRFVKPAAGLPAVHRIIEELVDARPEPVFPSYGALMGSLRTRQNRRSLVVLFTDLNDPQLAANLSESLQLASRRHVVVVISLRDPLLDRIASGPADDRSSLYQVLAARQLTKERATYARELHRIGASVLEADANSITIQLLNTYLSIKARQIL